MRKAAAKKASGTGYELSPIRLSSFFSASPNSLTGWFQSLEPLAGGVPWLEGRITSKRGQTARTVPVSY